VRVATVRAWARDSQVVVKFTSAWLRAKSARVVYCQAVGDKEFAVGTGVPKALDGRRRLSGNGGRYRRAIPTLPITVNQELEYLVPGKSQENCCF